MNLTEFRFGIKHLLEQNSTGILTGIGVVGTISTAILTGRASFKSARIIQDKEVDLHTEGKDPVLTDREKLELIWPQFIPPIGVGSVTIFSIIMANRLASKEAAALAAAYSISEQAFTQYKEKVVEKMGEHKANDIRDAVAQDRVNANPVEHTQVIIDGGNVLCMDALTGRYFESTMQKMQQAEIKANYEIVTHMYVSLSKFYDELGLQATAMSDMLGWNIDNRCELEFSTTVSTDKRPCLVMNFVTAPVPDYGRFY